MNTEMTPRPWSWLPVAGKPVVIDKVDEYTFGEQGHRSGAARQRKAPRSAACTEAAERPERCHQAAGQRRAPLNDTRSGAAGSAVTIRPTG